MNVLVIGAGAVGQVYGRHLQLGGAKISFFVRPKYAATLRGGVPVYPLRKRSERVPVPFEGFDVLTTLDEVRAGRFDQVWLAISSTALQGPWLKPMLNAIGNAILVSLQPGLEARRFLAARFPPERTVFGVIAFISYQAPLQGEQVPEPGVAYVFPPLSPSPFSGPKAPTEAIVKTLNAGGCPAKLSPDAPAWAATPTAIMMPHLAALEHADWRFCRLRRSPLLTVASAASREALAIGAHHLKRRPPLIRALVRPWLIRLITRVGPLLLPLDLETYIAYHFQKVGDQTRYLLGGYLRLGQEAGLSTAAIQALAQTAWPGDPLGQTTGRDVGVDGE